MTVIVQNTPINVSSNTTNVMVVKSEQPTIIKLNESLLLQSSGNNETRISFGYGDASPKLLGIFSGVIISVRLVISQPFNASAQLKIGTQDNVGLLLDSLQNNPQEKAEYETTPLINFSEPTQIFLSIALEPGVTQGNGYIIIERS